MAFILALWVVALLTYCWVLRSALIESELDVNTLDHQLRDTWQWLVNANGRRKRVERILLRQRRRYEALVQMHQTLAADVVGELLVAQDRKAVTKGLTRKL